MTESGLILAADRTCIPPSKFRQVVVQIEDNRRADAICGIDITPKRFHVWSARLRQREALDAMRNLVEAPAAAGQVHVGRPAVEAPEPQINEALYAMPKAARQAAAAGQMSLF